MSLNVRTDDSLDMLSGFHQLKNIDSITARFCEERACTVLWIMWLYTAISNVVVQCCRSCGCTLLSTMWLHSAVDHVVVHCYQQCSCTVLPSVYLCAAVTGISVTVACRLSYHCVILLRLLQYNSDSNPAICIHGWRLEVVQSCFELLLHSHGKLHCASCTVSFSVVHSPFLFFTPLFCYTLPFSVMRSAFLLCAPLFYFTLPFSTMLSPFLLYTPNF